MGQQKKHRVLRARKLKQFEFMNDEIPAVDNMSNFETILDTNVKNVED